MQHRRQRYNTFVIVVVTFLILPGLLFTGGQPLSTPQPVSAAFQQDQAIPQSRPVQTSTIPPIGEPGLNWQYAQTFGETGIPYYDDPSHLNAPMGITTAGDSVWVTEYNAMRIMNYRSDGLHLKQFGTSMGGYLWVLAEISTLYDVAVDSQNNLWLYFFCSPMKIDSDGKVLVQSTTNGPFSCNKGAIAVDANDRLFWSDDGNNAIHIFDSDGNYLKSIGEAGDGPLQFHNPAHITIKDNTLYVADQMNNRIQMFNIGDIDNIMYDGMIDIYQAGTNTDNFHQPLSVTADDTRIFVVDSGNNRVQVFRKSDHAYLATMDGKSNPQDRPFNNPTDIGVDENGTIYVSDTYNHRVQLFAPNLSWKYTIGETGIPYDTDKDHVNYPESVVADSEGNIYAAETSAHRVIKLASDGKPLASLGEAGIPGDDQTHFNRPTGLAVDAQDNLFISDQDNHRIQVFTKDGAFISSFGSQGDGANEFNTPTGVAVDSINHRIFVADFWNNRVQVYDLNWTYLTTIGETHVQGQDNNHFWNPYDVAVDKNGNIFISDTGNNRIQKCTLDKSTLAATCGTIVGTTGEMGFDYGHLHIAYGLGVDTSGRLYVVNYGFSQVRVYEGNGNFLGVLGDFGSKNGRFFLCKDVAVDLSGNVYVADSENMRIEKYTPNIPEWQQVNITGFGDFDIQATPLLIPYGDKLYAGFFNSMGAKLWVMNSAGTWTDTKLDGLGNPLNTYITSGLVFNNSLYLGTHNIADGVGNPTGAELYRYDGTSWQPIMSGGFGEPTNFEISSMAEFNSWIYAGTARADHAYDPAHALPAKIMRSQTGNPGSWETAWDFFGSGLDANNMVVRNMKVFNGWLYAVIDNYSTGSELWRSSNGSAWQLVIDGGFGMGRGGMINTLEVFKGYLYLGASSWGSGARLFRCQQCDTADSFDELVQGGFNLVDSDLDGSIDNTQIMSLLNYNEILYAWTQNYATGVEVWRAQDGLDWQKLNGDGFGTRNAINMNLPSNTIFNGRLYSGLNAQVYGIRPRVEVFKTGTGSGFVRSTPIGIDCGAVCSALFPANSSVTLSADPASGSTFTGWSGEGCSGVGTCSVTMDRVRSVSANFTKIPTAYSLSIHLTGLGRGTVTSTYPVISCGSDCVQAANSGSTVVLAATQETGRFTGWSGDCIGEGACTLLMNGPKEVTATFEQHIPVLTSFQKNGVQDANLPFYTTDFSANFTDIDGDDLITVLIKGLPTHGTLEIAGESVYLNQYIPVSTLAGLYYQPETGFTGTDSFSWTASDGLDFAAVNAIASILIAADSDGDNIGSFVEAGVSSLTSGGLTGDGNGDGSLDAEQTNVGSQVVPGQSVVVIPDDRSPQNKQSAQVGPKYFTLAAPSDQDVLKVRPLAYPKENPQPIQNVNTYPIGFVQFEIKNFTGSGLTSVELYYTGDTLPDKFYVFGAEKGQVKSHWIEFMYDGSTGAVFEKLPNHKIKITLHFMDGERGDRDLTVNGFINTMVAGVNTWKQCYLPAIAR